MAKYLLIQHYEGGLGCDTPMGAWGPVDIRAHIDFQVTLDADLAAAGELVDSQGVAQEGRQVISDGTTSTFAEATGKLLAGYRVIDVETEERALEIAARASAAPGAKGVPIQQPIEVRQIMQAP